MKFLLSWSLLFVSILLFADSRDGVSALARVDTNAMLIGDQIEFTIEVVQPKSIEVKWPFLVDTIGGFEIVDFSQIDTTEVEGDNLKMLQKLYLTHWDSGSYFIPSLNFQFKNKKGQRRTVRSNAIKIDITNLETPLDKGIMPNKPIKEVPFLWSEAIPYIIKAIIGLIVLALISLLTIWLYKKYNNKAEVYIPPRPPHEIALERINELKKQKLWQQGAIKEYYTELTEIIREYFEGRFDFPALEQTSDEIIKDLSKTDVAQSSVEKMKKLFDMADLVKFAKAKPATDNHLQSLKDAEAFVQHTKIKEEVVE